MPQQRSRKSDLKISYLIQSWVHLKESLLNLFDELKVKTFFTHISLKIIMNRLCNLTFKNSLRNKIVFAHRSHITCDNF